MFTDGDTDDDASCAYHYAPRSKLNDMHTVKSVYENVSL